LVATKDKAVNLNVILPRSRFIRNVAKNVYVSGGVGRSPIVRRRLLPKREEVPQRIPIPRTCTEWALRVGEGADDLFLQLAPVVGALSPNARLMGSLPAPIVPADQKKVLEDYDEMRGESLR